MLLSHGERITEQERMDGFGNHPTEALLLSPEEEVFSDYLHFAVHHCSEAAESYSGGAQLVLDTSAVTFLDTVAREKKLIASELRSYLKQPCYLLDHEDDEPTTVSISNYLLDVDLHASSSMDEAFLFAFKREHRSTDMFAKLAGLEQNESVRRLFNHLVERQHEFIRFMEAELVKLRTAEANKRDTSHSGSNHVESDLRADAALAS